MKIAMIGQKGIPARSGGIERHVEELSAELVKRGHEVLVFCRPWYVSPILDHRGVRCIASLGLHTKHFDAITHTLSSIFLAARENVDVFHFHGVGPALLSWLPKLLRPRAKVIVTFHCIDRHHQKWNAFARLSLWLGEWMACHVPDATIAVSKTLSAYCHLTFDIDPIYIPNGTHIPSVTPHADILKTFALEPGRYLLMCSRLVRHKGAHTLIAAWKRLKALHPDLTKEMKLVIVGAGAFTDDYVEELQRLASGETTIVLTGLQTGESLEQLFAGAYAVVHPSVSEGLPIAVLEAMGYGKCVLAADIPENMELIESAGMPFAAGDVEDLVRQMALLISYPELVQAVGREAREFVARHYDWEDIAEQTSYLYEAMHFIPNLKEAKS
jgi:glycosyltransferase involved in cell wall biosynthesis